MAAATSIVSCDGLDTGRAFPDVAPNSDISGIGVLIGFLATAYLTLILVIVYYLMGYIEKDFLNEVDTMVLIKLSPRKYFGSAPKLEATLRRVVLTFSDQQAVTGIALLGSGFAQLTSGIDSYHWQILVYLVWFSSLTHLTTLTVLRQYFLHKPAARLGRAVLMLVTVAMLGAALLPTGDILWFIGDDTDGNTAAVPALCFFRRLHSQNDSEHFDLGSLPGLSMVVSVLVLASGYLTRIIRLSERAPPLIRHWFKDKPGHFMQGVRDAVLQRLESQMSTTQRAYWVLGYISIETFHVWAKALSDFYGSMLWEILWLAFALAWGTRNLFIARANHRIIAESSWAFGQLFPILLLVLPLLSTVETYHEQEQPRTRDDIPSNFLLPGAGATVAHHKNSILIPVGQWEPLERSSTPDLAMSSEYPRAVARTGTDLESEEHRMGVVSSRRLQRPDQLAGAFNSPIQPAPSQQTGADFTFKYYHFQWVWIFILTIPLLTMIVIIAVLGDSIQIIEVYSVALLGMVWILVPSFFYTATFTMLSKFHRPLGLWIEVHLKIGRQKQKAALRFMAWCWPPVVLVGQITEVILYDYSIVAFAMAGLFGLNVLTLAVVALHLHLGKVLRRANF